MSELRTSRMARERSKSVVRRRRAVAGVSAFAGLLVVGAVLCAIAWMTFMQPAADIEAGQPAQVEIPLGASVAEIGRLLASAGVVENANMFRYEVRKADASADLKAGTYDLFTGMSYEEVIEQITVTPLVIPFVMVTIPEGFVLEQIAERFQEQANIPAEEFLALIKTGTAEEFPNHPYLASGFEGSFEGYLFPKTYRVDEGSTARDVVEMMLTQFDKETSTVDFASEQASEFSFHEIITIASIIEREAKVADERELISSVIHNRLAKGMQLESCATVEYVLPGNRLRLKYSDLEIDSPYNTYKYSGLPPGPIANPGIASIQAAVYPADTDYIYYVLTGEDGSHTFAETAEEFFAAKEHSKEVFGQ